MFNRLKSRLPSLSIYPVSKVVTGLNVDPLGRTQLHHLLPTLTHADQLTAYLELHGEKTVKDQLLTVSNNGFLPISPLSVDSPVLPLCLNLMHSSDHMLPPSMKADHSRGNKNLPYQNEDSELLNAGDFVINKARQKIKQAPCLPWMDPASDEAKFILDNEMKTTLALTVTHPEKHRSFPGKFATLCVMAGKGTSKAFALVGLQELAKSRALGLIEAMICHEASSEHYFLVISDIFLKNNVICDPLQGMVYSTLEMDTKLRIPRPHYEGDNATIHWVRYNPNYHSLKTRPEIIHAGSLANTTSLFADASLRLRHANKDISRFETVASKMAKKF